VYQLIIAIIIMKKILNLESAIEIFEFSAIQHTTANETADYKACNKAYKSLANSRDFLRLNNRIDLLIPLLNNENNGVRVWAASFLLFYHEAIAVKVLEDISIGNGHNATNARMTLSEWRKGNLKM
jgi:hypothetical protein